MALKATIFKVALQVADLDRHHYADYALTIARHPSETDERMMLRVAVFARHAGEMLALGRGISDTEEPDLWARDLTGEVLEWIELGLPDERRILKACGRARRVVVYAYGGAAARIWWQNTGPRVDRATNLAVYLVTPESMTALGALARRTMSLQAMLQDGALMLTSDAGMIDVPLEPLRAP